MKQFVMCKIPSKKVEMIPRKIGGLKISSCEFLAKLREIEKKSELQLCKGVRVRIESAKLEDVLQWVPEH